MRQAACSTQRSTYDVRHATRNAQRTTCNVQRTSSGMPCATCSAQRAARSIIPERRAAIGLQLTVVLDGPPQEVLALRLVRAQLQTRACVCACVRACACVRVCVRAHPAFSRFPLVRFPLVRFPLVRFPLGRFPLGRFPLGRFPLARFPLARFPLISLSPRIYARSEPAGSRCARPFPLRTKSHSPATPMSEWDSHFARGLDGPPRPAGPASTRAGRSTARSRACPPAPPRPSRARRTCATAQRRHH